MSRTSVGAMWLYASIVSMMFMGVYAFLIALSRAPGFNTLFPSQEFFRVALITHVVLSLVIWFLAFILFMAHRMTERHTPSGAEYLPAAGAFMGIGMIVITPFTGPVTPILCNYVPTLDNTLYLAGVALFIASAVAGWGMRAPALIRSAKSGAAAGAIGPLIASGTALAVAAICFILAWHGLRDFGYAENPKAYYESLFWGGGHVLQFANSFGLMAAWALLASMAGKGEGALPAKALWAVLGIMMVFVLSAPVEYFMDPAGSQEARDFFMELKRYGAGLGPVLAGGAAVWAARVATPDPVAARGLYMSIFLFGLGGLISLTLQGQDTRVPAHYHGVIGAVTLGFMAYALKETGKAGWLATSQKWQIRQVTLYGVGQSVFATGLYVGGLAGLPRKTFGAAQELDSVLKKAGMGIMGVGGLLAVAGGIMFVVFMLRSFYPGGKDAAAD